MLKVSSNSLSDNLKEDQNSWHNQNIVNQGVKQHIEENLFFMWDNGDINQ